MSRVSKYADKREELLSLVAEAMKTHGKPPSVRDLSEKLEVGVGTVHSYLVRLGEEGVIEWKPGRHRSLKLTQLGIQELSPPVGP